MMFLPLLTDISETVGGGGGGLWWFSYVGDVNQACIKTVRRWLGYCFLRLSRGVIYHYLEIMNVYLFFINQ